MRRILGTCVALGLGIVAACGSVQPSLIPATTPAPTPDPTAGPTASDAAPSEAPPMDLAAIIPGPGDRPADLGHDDTWTGADTLTMVVISGREAEFAGLPGFLDGRATTFSGSGGVLLTVALAFDHSAAADAAMHRYQNELASSVGYGFGKGEPSRFAFEGVCDTGPNPALDGLEESICIWHTGPIVFLVGGTLPMATIRSISEGLHDRATQLGAGP